MSKKILIDKCARCPYSRYDEIKRKAVCGFRTGRRHLRVIEDIEFIPDWCPLSYYKELENDNWLMIARTKQHTQDNNNQDYIKRGL